MTIRVVLLGQGDRRLRRPAGRVLLAHADHTFADLAEAVDTAFGRWDLTPYHQFQVEGRILLSPGAASESDLDAEDSDEVILGEVGLREGARFAYIFDLGEGWTHDCTVEEIGVDPFEVAGEEPEAPVAIFGWGTIPDQYGRSSEDEDDSTGDDLDELPFEDEDDDLDDEDLDEDGDEEAEDVLDVDDDEDSWEESSGAWEVVARALEGVEQDSDPADLTAAAERLRSDAGQGLGAVLWSAAGLDPGEPPVDDEDLWVQLAAGVVIGDPELAGAEGALDEAAIEAWNALEPADWAGAVIELVRSGPGTAAAPDDLVELIQRCPEVESEDLSADDREQIRAGLAVVVDLWRELGALDEQSALTPLGWWGLPRALQRAWGG